MTKKRTWTDDNLYGGATISPPSNPSKSKHHCETRYIFYVDTDHFLQGCVHIRVEYYQKTELMILIVRKYTMYGVTHLWQGDTWNIYYKADRDNQ